MAGQICSSGYCWEAKQCHDPNWHCRIGVVYTGNFHTMRRIWEKQDEANKIKQALRRGTNDPDRA